MVRALSPWISVAAALLALGACLRPAQPPLLLTGAPAHPSSSLLASRSPGAPSFADGDSPKPSPHTAIAAARRYLEGAPLVAGGYAFAPDPVGFVRAAYWEAGVDLFTPEAVEDHQDGLTILYQSARQRGQLRATAPEPGDLVFFSRTPQGDAIGAVAVVERIDAEGTVTAIGSFAGGPRRVVLNLREPQRAANEAGEPINDQLAPAYKDGTPHTTGVLFRSFARPLN